MNEAWMVRCYNEADAEFGYDSRPFTVLGNCTKAFATQMLDALVTCVLNTPCTLIRAPEINAIKNPII